MCKYQKLNAYVWLTVNDNFTQSKKTSDTDLFRRAMKEETVMKIKMVEKNAQTQLRMNEEKWKENCGEGEGVQKGKTIVCPA